MNGLRNSVRCGLVAGIVMLLAVSSLGLVAFHAKAAYAPEWTAATPMGDTRAQAAVVQDSNGLVYLLGGIRGSTSAPLTNASTYNIATGAWANLAPLPTAVRAAAAVVGSDGLVYVLGGGNNPGNATQIYDPAGDSWTSGANGWFTTWQGRAAMGFNGLIYVAGGWSNSGALAQLQIYDPVADNWSLGAPMPSARVGGAFVAYDGGHSFYYLGGSTTGWSDSTTTVYKYDVVLNTWTTMAPMPVARAAEAAVVGIDGLIYVFGGGADGSNFGSGYATGNFYSPANDLWGTLPDMLAAERQLGGAVTPDGKIVALGGSNSSTSSRQVEYLQTVLATATLSSSTVAPGGSVSVSFDIQLAFPMSSVTTVTAYLASAAGVVYATYSASSPVGAHVVMQVDVPAVAPAGSYVLHVSMPAVGLSLSVVDEPTLADQVDALQEKLNATKTLLDQMNATQTQSGTSVNDKLNTLQGDLDKAKADAANASLYGMIALILIIVVAVLAALLLVMGRKT